MAEALKVFFDARTITTLARELGRVHRAFDEPRFVARCLDGLDALSLTGRAGHIADAMAEQLPREFPRASQILVDSLGPELSEVEGKAMAPFLYLPHVIYVARYGLEHFEQAMWVQYELTKLFTAEFSIRAFLVRYPEATLARLEQWTRDPSKHVRRLVSEGTRPRLPWAPRLPAFQRDPGPVLALLERLKDDPERYVQRSVANNLNDISKDHPTLAARLGKTWLRDATPTRTWIVRHALRSLIKQGHPDALATLGYGNSPNVSLEQVRLSPTQVPRGGELQFSFTLFSRSKRSQKLVVDYIVHYVKANGTTRPKVFKLRTLVVAARGHVTLADRLSLRDLSTRRHYPGRHRIDVQVNGAVQPIGEFELT